MARYDVLEDEHRDERDRLVTTEAHGQVSAATLLVTISGTLLKVYCFLPEEEKNN